MPHLLNSHAFLDGVVAHSALSGEVAERLLSPALVDADEMVGEARWTPHLGANLVEMAEAIARSFDVDRSLAQPGEPPPLLVTERIEAATPPPALSWPESGTTEPVPSPRPAEQQVAPQEEPPLRTLGDLLRRELARQQDPTGPAPAIPRPAPAPPPGAEQTAPQQRQSGPEARPLPPRRARIVELPSSPATAPLQPVPAAAAPSGPQADAGPRASVPDVRVADANDIATADVPPPLKDVVSRPIAAPVPPGPAAPVHEVQPPASAVQPRAIQPEVFQSEAHPPHLPPATARTPAPAPGEGPEASPRSETPSAGPTPGEEHPVSPPTQQRPPPLPATTEEEETRPPGSAAVPSASLGAGPAARGPGARAPGASNSQVAAPSEQPPAEPAAGRPGTRLPLVGALVARLLGRRPKHEGLAHPEEPPIRKPEVARQRPDAARPVPQAAQEPVLELGEQWPPDRPEPTRQQDQPDQPARAPEPGPSEPRPSATPLAKPGEDQTASTEAGLERPEMPATEPLNRPPRPETPLAANLNLSAPAATATQDTRLEEPSFAGSLEEPARPDEPPRALLRPHPSGVPARASRYLRPSEPESPPTGLDVASESPWASVVMPSEPPLPSSDLSPGETLFSWPPTSRDAAQPPDLVPAMAPHLPELVLAPAANDRAEVEARPEQEDEAPGEAAGGREAPAPDVETLSREVYTLLKRRIALERERGFGR